MLKAFVVTAVSTGVLALTYYGKEEMNETLEGLELRLASLENNLIFLTEKNHEARDRVRNQGERISSLEEKTQALDMVRDQGERLTSLEEKTQALDVVRDQGERLTSLEEKTQSLDVVDEVRDLSKRLFKRLSSLEVKSQALNTVNMTDLAQRLSSLDEKTSVAFRHVDTHLSSLDQRTQALGERLSTPEDQTNTRITVLEKRLSSLEERMHSLCAITVVNERLDALEAKTQHLKNQALEKKSEDEIKEPKVTTNQEMQHMDKKGNIPQGVKEVELADHSQKFGRIHNIRGQKKYRR